MTLNQCYIGDVFDVLPTLQAEGLKVHSVVTSPPYFGLRDYGIDGQIGLENHPDDYVQKLIQVFRLIKPLLHQDSTIWLNLGDSYWNQQRAKTTSIKTALKPKDLVGIPWRVALALQKDGWYLRSDIIWAKPNPMPESVSDRPTKSHEYIFLLSKSEHYYFDTAAIKEPAITPERYSRQKCFGVVSGKYHSSKFKHPNLRGKRWQWSSLRNKRSVWTIPAQPYPAAHFAVFPSKLIEPCILAGTPSGGIVLDPFMGSGTTALVAEQLDRKWVGIELNADYLALQKTRLAGG